MKALEDRCLLSAGALDPTFGNGAGYVLTAPTNYTDLAYSALIQTDGKILAAGYGQITSNQVLTADDFVAVRYNTDGSLDTSFGSGGTALANFGSVNLHPSASHPDVRAIDAVAALYPQMGTASDGKIVLAGLMISNNGKTSQTFVALARFNTNGTLDATFGNKGEVTTSFSIGTTSWRGGVVVQPDGKIVAAAGSSTGFELARYNTNGTLDSSFGSGGKVVTTLGQSPCYADGGLLLQPDGKLIVSGDMDPSSGGHFWEMARYNPNGSLDTSFGTGGIVSGTFGAGADVESSALYPGGTANAGKIVVVGEVPGGSGMARYNPDGSLDNTFGTGGEVITTTGTRRAIAVAADGKLVVAGDMSSSFALFRYNVDGSVDNTFGTGGMVTTAVGNGHGIVHALTLQPNGDIVAAGQATVGYEHFAVARYLPSEPEIGSFTANQLAAGGPVTLTASNITDGNPNSTIGQVTFYYFDSNGTKHVLGTVTAADSSGNWTLSVSLPAGTYTLYAQATDSYGVLGDPLALPFTVQ